MVEVMIRKTSRCPQCEPQWSEGSKIARGNVLHRTAGWRANIRLLWVMLCVACHTFWSCYFPITCNRKCNICGSMFFGAGAGVIKLPFSTKQNLWITNDFLMPNNTNPFNSMGNSETMWTCIIWRAFTRYASS